MTVSPLAVVGAAASGATPVAGAPGLIAALARLEAPVVHTHCIRAVPGVEQVLQLTPMQRARTAERALVLAGPQDVVCLAALPDPAFVARLEELQLGPGRDRIVVPHPDAERGAGLVDCLLDDAAALRRIAQLLPSAGAAWLGPLMASPADQVLAAALGAHFAPGVRTWGDNPGLAARVNRKHVVRATAIELGLPVAEGTVVSLDAGSARDLSTLRAAVRRVAARTGRAIVRGDVGAAGSSVFVLDGTEDARALSARLSGDPQGLYLVEELLDVIASPNVQVFIDPIDRSVGCIGVTDQLLSPGLGHVGNIYPSRAATLPEMIGAALTFSRWLAHEGYAGVLGFDFVEYADTEGRPRYVLAELNPRYNGASQPVAMVERLNRVRSAAGRPAIGAFAAGVVSTAARSYTAFDRLLGERRFDPETGCGAVPFHTIGLPGGSCGVAVFGPTREEVEREFAVLAQTGAEANAAT